jgi:hypothetical protein
MARGGAFVSLDDVDRAYGNLPDVGKNAATIREWRRSTDGAAYFLGQ